MKKIFLIILCISFLISKKTIAQNDTVLLVGDSISITVSGASGDIQWQQSSDSINWVDIIGASDSVYNSIAIVSPSNKWHFRAEVGRTYCPNITSYSSGISYKVINSTNDLQVGDWYHGGIIFYLNGDGTGKIASKQDQGAFDWGCYGQEIGVNVNPVNFYEGATNTTEIVAFHDNLTNYYGNPSQCSALNDGTVAAKVCDTLFLNEYNDWYLPSKVELYNLIEEKNSVGGIDFVSYWSSTENVTFNAWIETGGGTQTTQEKYASCNVRCIREYGTTPVTINKLEITVKVINQPIPVEIVTDPISQNICIGDDVTISTVSTGSPVISYQWKKNGTPIIGADASSYSILNANSTDEAYYICEITNLCKTIESDSAAISMMDPVITVQPDSQIICLNNNVNFSVIANGATPFSYQWKKNNGNISNTDTNQYSIDSVDLNDDAYYHCEITNLCSTTSSDSARLKVVNLSTDAGTNQNICFGNSTLLQASTISNYTTESGNITYQWNPTNGISNAGISNPTADPAISTNYNINATDEIGCLAIDSIFVFVQNSYQNQIICMVSVDSLENINNVIWEKPVREDIDYFNVYRHSTGSYSHLGSLAYSEIPIFADTSSNPMENSSEYSITVIDTCGNESDYSPYHMTIHLSSAVGSEPGSIELLWNDYFDESGLYVPTEYHIYRGITSDAITYFTTVLNSGFTTESYSDLNAGDNRFYRISTDFPSPCDPAELLKGSNGPFSRALSNLEDNRQQGTSIKNPASGIQLQIFPNPMNESCTIRFDNPDMNSHNLQIKDVSGKTVRAINNIIGSEISFSRNGLSAGYYIIELKGDNIYRSRIIIE